MFAAQQAGAFLFLIDESTEKSSTFTHKGEIPVETKS
jgi:hypothetical protein